MTTIHQAMTGLLALSSSVDKPKSERAVKADTKKNRQALIDACERRNIDDLRRVIALGAPVNFLNDRSTQPSRQTPLGICVSENFIEGISELLDAGADEKLIPNYLNHPNGTARPASHTLLSCLEVAARLSKSAAFELLYPMHSEELRQRALSLVRYHELYLAARRLGCAGQIDLGKKKNILCQCLSALDPLGGTSDAGASRLQAFEALSEDLDVKNDPTLSSHLWTEALRLDRPGILQGLAAQGVRLPDDGQLAIVPSASCTTRDAPSEWVDMTLMPTSWDAKRVVPTFNTVSAQPVQVGLATAAAIFGRSEDKRALYALCAIKPLRDELMSNPIAIHFLARCNDLKLFKRLAELGCDLSTIRDAEGSNPLHKASANQAPKFHMEGMARLCSDWISQRDSKGKVPLEYDKSGRTAALSLLFDQIGMREGMKGKIGKRHDPARTRRL